MKAALVRPATDADLATLAEWSLEAAQPAAADETLLVAQAAALDDEPAALLGALRLRRAVGLALPRVWYHVGCTVHAASELKLFHRQRTLMLGHDHTGASELAHIVWARDDVALSDQAATLQLLVQTALLVLASNRGLYADRLIAELPGPCDSSGQSPFWQGLGRHFFSGDPQAATAVHGAAWRTYVSALLPRQPVYTSFLAGPAQAAIAQVHPDALLLREVLEQAGLRYSHHVNIEDAGPVLEAPTDDLTSVRRARRWTLAASPAKGGAACLVLAGPPGGAWRAARLRAQAQGKTLALTPETLQVLGLAPGAQVWAAALGGQPD
jgi:arginine N-succinyltransferase